MTANTCKSIYRYKDSSNTYRFSLPGEKGDEYASDEDCEKKDTRKLGHIFGRQHLMLSVAKALLQVSACLFSQ